MTANKDNIKISDNNFTDIQNIDKNIDKNKEKIPEKNIKRKCNYISCSKKLSITDIECKCKFIFCSFHRLAEQHDCSFNYKSFDTSKLINDMKCTSNKLIKI